MEFGLAELLRAAWIAGILPIVIASLPFSCLSSFRAAVLGFAKRGKIMQSSALSKFTVPHTFFSHFYVLAVVWTTLLLITTWVYAYRTAPLDLEPFAYFNMASYLAGGSNIFSFHTSHLLPVESRYGVWVSVFLLLLMEFQVLRRLLETVCVFKNNPSARMHIFGYLAGLFFYMAAPLSLCCSCAPEVFKFCVNGVKEIIVIGKGAMTEFEVDWRDFLNYLLKLGWWQWIGAAVFFWGWIRQCRCHAILGSLRDSTENGDKYVVPHGDWFEYVSSPHYLAEIVIYAGLLFASGGTDLTIWLLFGFVVANLAFAAAETHRWYHRKFDNYPSNRYAIIPVIC